MTHIFWMTTVTLYHFNKSLNMYHRHTVSVPRETRAGTALLSIQKDTQDSITISMVGKYV